MNTRNVASLCAVFVLLCCTLQADPQIRSLDPPPGALLGQSVYWILEVRHPLWESYDLSLDAPAGMEMQVESALHRRQQDDMITVYRVRLVAQSLAVSGPPAASFNDARGRNFTVTGRPIHITPISGASVDVREPGLPRFRKAPSETTTRAAAALIAVLILVLAVRWWIRRRDASPRHTLLRNLKEALALAHGSKPPDPGWLCILLRSELLWGERVDAVTVAELAERGPQTAQHAILSEALATLEEARYSGGVVRDAAMLERTVHAAMDLLQQ